MARDEDRFDERNRYRDRGGQWRGRDWSDADDYYGNRGSRGEDPEQWRGDRGSSRSEGGRYGGDWSGNNRGYNQHGAYDEGSYGAREYGEGMYNRRPGQHGQESYGGGGTGGQSGWGTGRGQNREGYSGHDRYGGGGSGGGFNASGGYEQQQRNQWNAYQPGGYQQGTQNAGQWDRHSRRNEWGGNESMGHGDWGSGHQRGGGYQWQEENAAENYRGSTWGSANYGSGSGYGGPSAQGYTGGAGTQHNYGGMRNEQPQYGSIMQGQRSYAGRGPKGWRRSDERIQEDLSEQLERHPQIDASDIEVHVENGEVTMTGTVPDRQSKRLAEDVAESVWGVHDVQNQIKVKREQHTGGFFSGLFGTADDRDRDERRQATDRDRTTEGANTAAVQNASSTTTNR